MPTDDPSAASPSEEPKTQLKVEAAESFNYAAWQNDVPLLKSLSVENPKGEGLSSLVVELTASPPFARPKRWTIDRVGPQDVVDLRDIDLDIDADYLHRLDEAERGVLRLRLSGKNLPEIESSVPLRILARDEWGGMGTMGELLPAFVTPNDPALAPLLKAAGDAMTQAKHSSALDGYQSGDPGRAYLLTASLWSAVAAKSLTYSNPPGSFERVGQKTRRVANVLADGLATCLDTTLLFASGLEAIGLNPVIVMTQGHCFAAVWLVDKTLKKLVEPDPSELRKAIAAKELVPFETTLVTHRPAAPFPDAVRAAEDALAENREHEFVAAIDVARARMAQVRPLATHGAREDRQETLAEAAPLPLPEAPVFDRLPAEETEEKPQTPAGRIDRWQRKLLDLSLRNRLLNFKPTKQTVPVVCPDVSGLEDHLADGGRLRMVSLRDENRVTDRDATLHRERTQKDLDVEFARRALEKNELACPVETRDLDARLTTLYRKGKNDLAEGGSNTIYLAVGFLRWRPDATEDKTYRAPLLLVPVKLTRRSASSPFYLASHEDDVRFNATLLQLLKKDFDCDLTAMESNLPTDDSGIDVPLVLERMRRAVRDIPGFEVVEEAAIGSFSFAKYLMWKDLVERVDQLEQNRVVRHLVNEPDKAFAADGVGSMPQPREIDTRYQPADIVHPLPADSSQLAAVMAASEGHDLVIVGPPGTGKSQTIANLITQCLSVGKTVLFVAEKTAALDVVHRRLREHGLGDCCVELHSNKAERRRFLEQMEASWKNRSRPNPKDWIDVTDRLRVRRDELNAYVAALHEEHPNGWTAYGAMGRIVKGREVACPRLDWPSDTTHARDDYRALESAVANAALAYGALPNGAEFDRVQAGAWSMAWETELLEACRRLDEVSAAAASAVGLLAGLIGIPELTDLSSAQLSTLYRFALDLTRIKTPPEELLLCERLEELSGGLSERQTLHAKRDHANTQLRSALEDFCGVLSLPTDGGVAEATKRSLYRLANELVRSASPRSELVFHSRADELPELLRQRTKLLEAYNAALQAVEARSYNATLMPRMPVDSLLKAWGAAGTSFWPLSVMKKRAVTKKLRTYVTAGGVPDPEVDLPLLAECRESGARLAENLTTLSLPDDLQAAVAEQPGDIDEPLTAAQQLREALRTAGADPDSIAESVESPLEAVTAAARALYPPGRELETLRKQLRENLAGLEISPELQAEVEEEATALDPSLDAAKRLRAGAASLALGEDAAKAILRSLLSVDSHELRAAAADYCRRAKEFQEAWQGYAEPAGTPPAAKDSAAVFADARAAARGVQQNRTQLKQWTAWIGSRRQAESLGLGSFLDGLGSGEVTPTEAASQFELAYSRWWLPLVVDRSAPLRTFQRFQHEDTIEDFRRLDELARKAAAPHARQAVYHDLPSVDQVPRKSELGLLRHQMGLKRPSRSIRDVIAGMPESFGKLAPCLLMSPLSIAQYLPAGQAQFDVVVFDEASQIATWDAIGAIARGKQTIIVGDPKQLPPTNFFGKVDSDEENEELDDFEKDLESILDEAQASGLPTLQLNWHYRSRHESLIAFSNYSYYGNQLVTFPAAESEDRGVSLTVVEEALYDRGKSRTNRLEAEAIVADAVARMKRCLRRPEAERLTYGVVTFNSQQQSLIQDLFDEALRKTPELEWFFADERIEPTAVKNLENVQGDERDVMYFSITFGQNAAGLETGKPIPVDFGAINRDGGERRLNVAITRARQALLVYASFLPDQLRAERSGARGVHDLKAFLDYAHRGQVAIYGRTEGSVGDYESPLEEAVAAMLSQRGWQVEPQIGVSGFRVDIGVIHPDRPGAYLGGIECDGATYHRSAAARDRDKTRQFVLENLGWNILRVWSPDWWYDQTAAEQTLHKRLEELLAASRAQTALSEAATDDSDDQPLSEDPTAMEHGVLAVNPTSPHVDGGDSEDDQNADLTRPQLVAKNAASSSERIEYQLADLPDATNQQSRFFDAEYRDELQQMAFAVLEAEGPIRDDLLVRRIARAHGYARAGSKIKNRVLELLPDVSATEEPVGRFLWPGGNTSSTIPFRNAVEGTENRRLDEVPMEELMGLVRGNPHLVSNEDPALELARSIGLTRLAQRARDRLESAIEQATQLG